MLRQARIGDVLFVAYGSKYPLALRLEGRDESSYSLVGCALIEGLMDGEAVDNRYDGSGKIEGTDDYA